MGPYRGVLSTLRRHKGLIWHHQSWSWLKVSVAETDHFSLFPEHFGVFTNKEVRVDQRRHLETLGDDKNLKQTWERH